MLQAVTTLAQLMEGKVEPTEVLEQVMAQLGHTKGAPQGSENTAGFRVAGAAPGDAAKEKHLAAMGAALEAELRSMFERVQETVDKEVKLSRRGSRRKDVMNGDEAGADPHRMVSSSAESTSLEAVMQSRPSTSRSDRERLINEHESGLAKVAAREATARGRAEENLKRKLEIRRNKKKALDSGSHSSNLNLEAERLDGLRRRLISEHEVSLAQVAARRAVEQGRAEEELKRQLEIRRNKRKALESARRRIRGELINSDDAAESQCSTPVNEIAFRIDSGMTVNRFVFRIGGLGFRIY